MAQDSQARPPLLPPAGATAAEWSAKWFGGPTRLSRITVTIATTPTQVLGNNPKRVFWSANNRSVNDGALGGDNTLTFANGDLLPALGGRAESAVQEDGEAVAWAVFGIQNAAAGDWVVTEITRV